MDRLKFRAWDDDFGDFLTINMFELNNDGEIIGIVHKGDFIGYNKDKTHLMQYIGLKDMNGEEIYKGDIIKYWNLTFKEYEICEIRWIDKFITYVATDRLDNNIFIQSIDEKRIEIIGNIYKNAELLNSRF